MFFRGRKTFERGGFRRYGVTLGPSSVPQGTPLSAVHILRPPAFSPVVDGVERTRKPCRRLRKDAVPTLFSFRPAPSPSRPSLSDRLVVGAARAFEMKQKMEEEKVCTEEESERKMRKDLEEARRKVEELEERVRSLSSELVEVKSRVFCFENIKHDSKQLRFLTGVDRTQWDTLWSFLDIQSNADILSEEAAAKESEGRQYAQGSGREPRLSLEDQLLLTLMKLRLGSLHQELGYIFSISKGTVSLTFKIWINFLYLRLGSIPIWPDWEDVQATMPECFKNTYPVTFMVIDATELHCQIPSTLKLQSQLYSPYLRPTCAGFLASG